MPLLSFFSNTMDTLGEKTLEKIYKNVKVISEFGDYG